MSIAHPDFLSRLYPHKRGFRDVEGTSAVTNKKDVFAGMDKYLSLEESRINLLNFAEVENNCKIKLF